MNFINLTRHLLQALCLYSQSLIGTETVLRFNCVRLWFLFFFALNWTLTYSLVYLNTKNVIKALQCRCRRHIC